MSLCDSLFQLPKSLEGCCQRRKGVSDHLRILLLQGESWWPRSLTLRVLRRRGGLDSQVGRPMYCVGNVSREQDCRATKVLFCATQELKIPAIGTCPYAVRKIWVMTDWTKRRTMLSTVWSTESVTISLGTFGTVFWVRCLFIPLNSCPVLRLPVFSKRGT